MMDINVSVSNWETFGRGILEGACAGLPTFVPKRLTVIKRLCGEETGVLFSSTISQMADQISKVISNEDTYIKMSMRLAEMHEKFSYKAEHERLLKAILGGGDDESY